MKAELYTLSYCPHCVAAVNLLESRGVETINHVMDTEFGELDQVKAKHGHDTVPIVLIDGVFLGGNDALKAFDAAGKLAE
ncbi:MAG: glutaredoxin 3 [Candidatus Paceibacteria bacterium]|jgi:glutaredoxin 3